MAQCRKKQSPEKVEATRRVVEELLKVKFITEEKYTTWLSNVDLVRKANDKWRMCVDYLDLDKADPKDT